MVSQQYLEEVLAALPQSLRILYRTIPERNRELFIEFIETKYAPTFKQYFVVMLYEEAKFSNAKIPVNYIKKALNRGNKMKFSYMKTKQDLVDYGLDFTAYTRTTQEQQQDAIIKATEEYIQLFTQKKTIPEDISQVLQNALNIHIADFYPYLMKTQFNKGIMYLGILLHLYFPEHVKEIVYNMHILERDKRLWLRRPFAILSKVEDDALRKIDTQVHEALGDKYEMLHPLTEKIREKKMIDQPAEI